MHPTPVIAIFDIGKTNKKLFLFDEGYNIVHEESRCFEDGVDDDGEPCESLEKVASFVFDSLQKVLQNRTFIVKAVNASAYGASFVHINASGTPVAPLYSYLKAYPNHLSAQFYDAYGGMKNMALSTASPVLGYLNSGLQLYWLKHAKQGVFKTIHRSLHLPQYISFLLSGKAVSDYTSIGCHTALWDFEKVRYHNWVYNEGVVEKLAPIVPSTQVFSVAGSNGNYNVGVGLHDSSAALIPYLLFFKEPFVLLSTGTWCISLNPFNQSLLTYDELQQDCLCYLTYAGAPVKASRLFAGNEHEQQVKRLAAHFNKEVAYYKSVRLQPHFFKPPSFEAIQSNNQENNNLLAPSPFTKRDLTAFATYDEAYHQLMHDIMVQQVASTKLVLNGTAVKRIFVDGGFSKNGIYMHLLAAAFPQLQVFAASVAQATAVGAALAIHAAWNTTPLPSNLLVLKQYNAGLYL